MLSLYAIRHVEGFLGVYHMSGKINWSLMHARMILRTKNVGKYIGYWCITVSVHLIYTVLRKLSWRFRKVHFGMTKHYMTSTAWKVLKMRIKSCILKRIWIYYHYTHIEIRYDILRDLSSNLYVWSIRFRLIISWEYARSIKELLFSTIYLD